ncbi:hypothetical protein OK016_22025 [Vibrio chagasii]|nr:hypothetical protein [Vibrio chagasii]
MNDQETASQVTTTINYSGTTKVKQRRFPKMRPVTTKLMKTANITGVEVVYENASQAGGGGDLVPGAKINQLPKLKKVKVSKPS